MKITGSNIVHDTDVTVDIVLDEMGRPDPSKIKTIIEMPPGVGGAFPQMPGVEFR